MLRAKPFSRFVSAPPWASVKLMASESATAIPEHQTQEISRDELMLRLQDPSLTIVDARAESLYLDDHLPRAINIPVTEVGTLAAKLLPDRSADIAVYCAGFS